MQTINLKLKRRLKKKKCEKCGALNAWLQVCIKQGWYDELNKNYCPLFDIYAEERKLFTCSLVNDSILAKDTKYNIVVNEIEGVC